MVEKQETQTLKIKTAWHEVTLSEFIKIGEISGDESLSELSLQKRIRMIAVISNKTFEEICEFDSDYLMQIIEAAAFLDKDPPKRNKPKPFTIDGIKYTFHPKFEALTGGEMISIEQLLMDAHHNNKNATADILSIMIRPVEMIDDESKPGKQKTWIQKFNAETVPERKALFMDKLTADHFIHELSFFFADAKSKSSISQLYSALLNPTQVIKKNGKKKSLTK